MRNTSSLGSIAEIKAGSAFPPALQGKQTGDYPFAKVADISHFFRQGHSTIGTANNYINSEDFVDTPRRLFPVGTIVFPKIGEAIRANARLLTTCEMLFDNNVMGLIPDVGNVSSRYLYHYLRTVDFYALANSTSVPALRKSVLEKIPVPLPPLDEQKRIAAILDKADAIRRKRQQAMELADEFLRAVFLDMFGDPVTNPKGWDVALLKDVATIASGVTKGKKYGKEQLVEVPYMRVANVQDGRIDISDVKTISVSHADVERYSLQKGDLLLTEGGDPDKLGRGAVWDGSFFPCIHQNHIFKVRFDISSTLPEFASFLIGSSRGKNYFLRAAKQTTGIATINKAQLSNFEMLVPDMELQEKFVRALKEVKSIKLRLKQIYDGANSLFSSLQQHAFQGNLSKVASHILTAAH